MAQHERDEDGEEDGEKGGEDPDEPRDARDRAESHHLKDEQAEERNEHTRLYFNKDEYNANKDKDKNYGKEN